MIEQCNLLEAMIMKKKYQPKSATPYLRSNFHPLRCVAPNRKTIVDSNESVEYVKPAFSIEIVDLLDQKIVHFPSENLCLWPARNFLD